MRRGRGALVVVGLVALLVLGAWLVFAPVGERDVVSVPSALEDEGAARVVERPEVERSARLSRELPRELPDLAPTVEASPQEGVGVIFGTVSAEEGEVPPGVEVRLLHVSWGKFEVPRDDVLDLIQTVDGDHRFRFEGLPLGLYILHASGSKMTGDRTVELFRENPEREVEIELRLAGSISGGVYDGEGNPLANAVVYVSAWRQLDSVNEATQARAAYSRVYTDEEGRYVLDSVQIRPTPVEYRLAAHAPGFAVRLSEYVSVGDEGVDFYLGQGVEFSGIAVYRESGDAAAGKRLTLSPATPLHRDFVETDEAGRFGFLVGGPGKYRIDVLDPIYVVSDGTATVRVDAEMELPELRIELVSGGVISGSVLDEDTGMGIAGVPVTANSRSEDFEDTRPLTATTGMKGRYALRGLKAGNYGVRAGRIAGYPNPTPTSGRQEVLVKASAVTGDVDFSFSKGILLSGIVVDTAGAPVADVRVQAKPGRGRRRSGMSGADGSFVVAGLAARTTYRLSAEKKGYGAGVAGPFEAEDDDVEGVRIALTTPGSIAGVVVSREGETIPGVVVLANDELHLVSRRSETTRDDGAFLVSDLSGGRYQLSVGVAGSHSFFGNGENRDVMMEDGEDVRGVRLLYSMPGKIEISGRVVDGAGNPIEDARVSESRGGGMMMGRSDEDGYYRMVGDSMFLRSGSTLRRLEATHRDYNRAALENVALNSTTADFVMYRRAAIAGRVVDARTGRAITGFRLWSRLASESDYNDVSRAGSPHSDENGAFLIEKLETPEQILFVRAGGYANAREVVDGLYEGRTRGGVVIALEPAAVIEGVVLDPLGAPLRGARVFVGGMPEAFRDYESLAVTNGVGEFRIDSVSPGDYLVSASHGRYASVGVNTVAVGSGGGTIQIQLSEGGRVEGTVRWRGAPVEGHRIRVNYPGEPNRGNSQSEIVTDVSGHYSAEALREGEAGIGLYIQREGVRSRSVPVEVRSGETVQLDFDFYVGTGAITGTIYSDDGRPVAGTATVAFELDGVQGSVHVQADRDGRYRIDGLPSVLAELEILGQGIAERPTVEVEAVDGELLVVDSVLD